MKLIYSLLFLTLIFTASSFAGGPITFVEAKIIAKRDVFFDHAESDQGELYCGCKWQWVGKTGGRIDHSSCGYEVRKQENRAARIEWEHIVPAWTFGHQRQCWQNGGRKNCVATDSVFRAMEADLFNLYPAVGEVNGDRANYNYGIVSGASTQYGRCDTRIDFGTRTAEPRNEVKGLVARTTFYMFDRYNLNMSRQQQRLLMAWNNQYPTTAWERERNERIARVVGFSNPFVTGERAWFLGYKPVGEGVASLASNAPAQQMVAVKRPLQEVGMLIIGNRRSGVYHLPAGCPSYGQVSAKNQISFDSEAEALKAGFRKAGNCR
ncbi:endonuclease [Pseudomonas mendocina]|nr:endonuclease [Pseudomonas mendocina]MBH3341588.1 endonuclease [Pseudomonas mendocina]